MYIYLDDNLSDFIRYDKDAICIPITTTDEILEMIDKKRESAGKKPFFFGKEIDFDGWYDAWLVVNRSTFEPIEIEACVAFDCEAEEKEDTIYHFEDKNMEISLPLVIRGEEEGRILYHSEDEDINQNLIIHFLKTLNII